MNFVYISEGDRTIPDSCGRVMDVVYYDNATVWWYLLKHRYVPLLVKHLLPFTCIIIVYVVYHSYRMVSSFPLKFNRIGKF